MMAFVVYFVLGWLAVGAALFSRINRGEFEADTDEKPWRPREWDDLEIVRIFSNEGLGGGILIVLLILVAWPWLLYMAAEEKKND